MKKLYLIILLISIFNLPRLSAQDLTIDGNYDTLYTPIAVTGNGYWRVTSGNSNYVKLFNQLTHQRDSTDVNAIAEFSVDGTYIFTWYSENQTPVCSLEVVVSNYIYMNNGIASISCSNDIEVAIDTSGYGNGNFYWLVDPEWEHHDEVAVSFNPNDKLPVIHREFSDAAFGDSAHLILPLKLYCNYNYLQNVRYLFVRFYQKPDVHFNNDTIFTNNSIELYAPQTSAWYEYEWRNASDFGWNTNFTVELNQAGTYPVVLSVANILGYDDPSCFSRDTVYIVYQEASNYIDFSFLVDTSILSLPFTLDLNSLANSSQSSGPFHWEIYDDQNVLIYEYTGPLPNFTFTSQGVYQIYLSVEGSRSAAKHATLVLPGTHLGIHAPKVSTVVYPNPTKDLINISNIDYRSVILVDLCGKVVLETQSNKPLDVSHLKKGLYLAKIYTDKQVYTESIVIE